MMIPYTPEAHLLFTEGAQALAEIESNGIRIDQRYLKRALPKTRKEINNRLDALRDTEVGRLWKKRFKGKTNLTSDTQLGTILFDEMGFEPIKMTKGGERPSTDEASLLKVPHPFVKDYLELKKVQKALQFLEGIQKQVCDGFIHPFFNLNRVTSYRSSSSEPNFQQYPNRNPVMRRLVRRCFIPRKGRMLVEIDFGGIEVRVAYCYHKDPQMRTYLLDKSTDMHRDAAADCYQLPVEEVTKAIRHCGKNMFVFPQFYGSYWLDCSAALWDAAQATGDEELTTVSGVPLRKHLAKLGLKELGDQDKGGKPKPGSFEEHIANVGNIFWDERFPVYTAWKKQWYADYQEKGWFPSLTGFVYQGHLKRNKVLNYAIQGSAFHCLLRGVNELVLRRLRRGKWKTKIVGQIHDSLVADVPVEELDEFLALCQTVLVDELMAAWDWIIIPMEVDVNVTPVGMSWADQRNRKKVVVRRITA